MSESLSHAKTYLMVFGALCLLTLLSVGADVIELNSKIVVAGIVLAIATAKAIFVMMYFMHLKFEGPWKYMLLVPTLILAASIPLALFSDISLDYYEHDPNLSVESAASASDSSPMSHTHEKVSP